jgi:hypothetical protein
MKINTFCLAVTAGLAFGGSAFAQSAVSVQPGDTLVITRQGSDLGIARTEPMEGIRVTAPALREGSLVAVRGTIAGREGRNLLISSANNGQVLARIHETGSPEVMFYAKPIASRVSVGDPVTVFGSLKKDGGGLMVRADAVFDQASSTLYFPSESDQLNASPFNPAGNSNFFGAEALNKRYRVL